MKKGKYDKYFRLVHFATYVMQAVEKEGYKHYVRDIMMQSSSVADFKKKLVKGGMFPGSLSLLVKEWNKRRRK